MKPDKKIDARRLAENEEKKIKKPFLGFQWKIISQVQCCLGQCWLTKKMEAQFTFAGFNVWGQLKTEIIVQGATA